VGKTSTQVVRIQRDYPHLASSSQQNLAETKIKRLRSIAKHSIKHRYLCVDFLHHALFLSKQVWKTLQIGLLYRCNNEPFQDFVSKSLIGKVGSSNKPFRDSNVGPRQTGKSDLVTRPSVAVMSGRGRHQATVWRVEGQI
jgi:hypothetical protein